MKDVIIVDSKNLESKISRINQQGLDSLYIVSDFDGTITSYDSGGAKTCSSASIVSNYFPNDEYKARSHELFDYYHPLEINHNIDFGTKRKYMDQWWQKHMDLICEYNIQKNFFSSVLEMHEVVIRKKFEELLHVCENYDVPLLIFSAGFGDIIEQVIAINRWNEFEMLFVASNFFEFDSTGNVLSYQTPLITPFSKNFHTINEHIYNGYIKTRKNLILMGDSILDSNMDQGVECHDVIKIGVCDFDEKEMIQEFCNVYDVLLNKDAGFEFVLEILK